MNQHKDTEVKETPKANMQQIVMKKVDLIKVLKDNKDKHDVVLATAQAGYWELAKEKIEKKKATLEESLGNFKEDILTQINRLSKKIESKETLPGVLSYKAFGFDNSINLSYPEDHSKDYERAIRMMELSVYDEVSLTEYEFDAYVLNNWNWKANFVASNSGYVDTIRARYGQKGIDEVSSKLNKNSLALSGYCTGIATDGIANNF